MRSVDSHERHSMQYGKARPQMMPRHGSSKLRTRLERWHPAPDRQHPAPLQPRLQSARRAFVIGRREWRTPARHPPSLCERVNRSVRCQLAVRPCGSIARPSNTIDEPADGNRETNLTGRTTGFVRRYHCVPTTQMRMRGPVTIT